MAQVPGKLTRVGWKRRLLGWMLLGVGVVVAGVWVASGWWAMNVVLTNRAVSVYRGSFIVVYCEGNERGISVRKIENPGLPTLALIDEIGFHASWDTRLLALDELMGSSAGGYRWRMLHKVLWPAPLLTLALGGLLLVSAGQARRHSRMGKCPSCGYDLTGLGVGAVRPECGKGGGTK